MSDRAGLNPARLFLALWPDIEVCAGLAAMGGRLREQLSGRLTRPETIHLTLVFIGDLARDRIPELIDGLTKISVPAFRIEFDRAGCWRHNHIAYLAPSRPPEELLNLVEGLEAALNELTVGFDRRPYRPHVTLVRKADCEKANPAGSRVSNSPVWGDFRPIIWSAKHFALMESVTTPDGVRYENLGSFRLL